jgi:hypothetical protein
MKGITNANGGGGAEIATGDYTFNTTNTDPHTFTYGFQADIVMVTINGTYAAGTVREDSVYVSDDYKGTYNINHTVNLLNTTTSYQYDAQDPIVVSSTGFTYTIANSATPNNTYPQYLSYLAIKL